MIKIMILGSSQVGKTSLMQQFCENKFDYQYEATKGVDFRSKMIENTKVVVFDTPGYLGLRESSYGFYKTANAFILLFDLAQSDTLQDLVQDIKMIILKAQSNVQLILVGNKSDLQRQVDYNEALQFAEGYNIPYVEISCQNNDNVNIVFEDLLERVQTAQNFQQKNQIVQEERYCCSVQ